ncbi:MAG: zf-HC2 domain-containing protein [Bacteroidales bacterium]
MKQTNCEEIENNLLFYINNELSSELKSSITSHLTECEHCNCLVNEVSSTMQIIEAMKIKENDPYFYTRLNQRMESQHTEKDIFAFFPKRILQLAAIFCLLAIGSFTGIRIGNQYNPKNAEVTAEETRALQLNAYSEENYIAEISNEDIESLFTSNQ